MRQPQPGSRGEAQDRVLAAADILIVLAAAGGVVVMSGAKQATAAARQLPVDTAPVQKRTLSP